MRCLQLFLLALWISSIVACKPADNQDQTSAFEAHFEFLDSVKIASLAPLFLSDVDASGRMLLNDWYLEHIYVTDRDGSVSAAFEASGEGPDQVSSPVEVAFWEEGLLIKEMSPTQSIHIFNGNFKKIQKSPALAIDLVYLTIPNMGKSFSTTKKDDKTVIIGSEINVLSIELLQTNKASFYESAEAGYIFTVETGELVRFNPFPANWEPRKNKKWVGNQLPIMQLSQQGKILAILPTYGDQLFFYAFDSNQPDALFDLKLVHPERSGDMAYDANEDDSRVYPFFNKLYSGDDYLLAEFSTAFPKTLLESFKMRGNALMTDPEYLKAMETYGKSKYILVDTKGNQAAISELPREGSIQYMDADNVIYIKPKEDVESDFNVFYRYRVSLRQP